MEDWMVIPMQATVTSSWLSTIPVGQSSGRSSLGHQVVIMIMELPPTHPETSMCRETHMEDWMVIPTGNPTNSLQSDTLQVKSPILVIQTSTLFPSQYYVYLQLDFKVKII